MSLTRSTFFKWIASGAVAAAALLGASAASARGDVSWSVGVNLPGVALGVAAPTYYAPPPVYYAPPPPVYYRPAPPVYYRPAPVYYAPPPVYYRPAPGYYRGHGHRGYYR